MSGRDDGDGGRDGSLEGDTEALRREILDLPKNTGSRKVTFGLRSARPSDNRTVGKELALSLLESIVLSTNNRDDIG